MLCPELRSMIPRGCEREAVERTVEKTAIVVEARCDLKPVLNAVGLGQGPLRTVWLNCCYPVEARNSPARLPCIAFHTKTYLTMLTREYAAYKEFVGKICFKQAFVCLQLRP